MSLLDRRTALKGAGGLCAVGLASACGAGAGGGQVPNAAGLASAGPLVALADVPVGQSAVIDAAGAKLAVYRVSETEVVAHTAVCTHSGCTVNAAGAELACPCHGSRFNAADGSVLNGPAGSPLAAVSVKVDGASVVAG